MKSLGFKIYCKIVFENGYIDLLLKNIPSNEYTRWQMVFDMIAGDVMENERSLVSYLDTNIKAINKSVNTVIEIIGEIVQNKEE